MASLRRQIVERNNPSLPENIAKNHQGGYDGFTVIYEALQQKTECTIQHLMKVLKNILQNEFRTDKERRAFMDLARIKNWGSPLRSEAVERVYSELYGTTEAIV